MKPLFSILHTSARPDKWRAVYDAWVAAAFDLMCFEYILVCDKRWGFTELPQLPGLKSVWNTARRCYVDGVNIAAQYATGSTLIVAADDQFPCEHWDLKLAELLADSGKEVIEVWTGTPQEHERDILVMPVLTRARYERLGYVLFPGYESMFADNDFCEMAKRDGQIADGRALMFPHRHPTFDTDGVLDDAYKAQNRPEAYEVGAQVLMQRRQANFDGERKKKLAVIMPGETFSSSWVSHALMTMKWLNDKYELVSFMGYTSNVFATRAHLAIEALKCDPDFILWIDDDNPVGIPEVATLLLDLESIPELDIVAGWCLCAADAYEVPVLMPSVGFFGEDGKRLAMTYESLKDRGDIVEIGWTGFPVVLMRGAALKKVPNPFHPIPREGSTYGFDSEDISFSRRAKDAGLRMAVDPRVQVPHLKLRDANITPALSGISKGEN